MRTCEIQWVELRGTGEPTPDQSPAVGRVRLGAHTVWGRGDEHVWMEASRWFAICVAHARRMTEPGMEHWEWEGRLAPCLCEGRAHVVCRPGWTPTPLPLVTCVECRNNEAGHYHLTPLASP